MNIPWDVDFDSSTRSQQHPAFATLISAHPEGVSERGSDSHYLHQHSRQNSSTTMGDAPMRPPGSRSLQSPSSSSASATATSLSTPSSDAWQNVFATACKDNNGGAGTASQAEAASSQSLSAPAHLSAPSLADTLRWIEYCLGVSHQGHPQQNAAGYSCTVADTCKDCDTNATSLDSNSSYPIAKSPPCSDESCNANATAISQLLAACCNMPHQAHFGTTCNTTQGSDVCCPNPPVNSCNIAGCTDTHDHSTCTTAIQACSAMDHCPQTVCQNTGESTSMLSSKMPHSFHGGHPVFRQPDGCVSICDGVVDHEGNKGTQNDCQGCSHLTQHVDEGLDKHIFEGLQELLNCCYCAGDLTDSCCPDSSNDLDQPQQHLDHVTHQQSSAIVGPACSTQQYGQCTIEQPQDDISALLNMAIREDCPFDAPHPHNQLGMCVVPQGRPWGPSSVSTMTSAESLPLTCTQDHNSDQYGCRWAGCAFCTTSLRDLVKHVNLCHLTPQQSQQHPQSSTHGTQSIAQGDWDQSNGIATCQWDSCGEVRSTSDQQDGRQNNFAMLQHLVESHLLSGVQGTVEHGCQRTDLSPSGSVGQSRLLVQQPRSDQQGRPTMPPEVNTKQSHGPYYDPVPEQAQPVSTSATASPLSALVRATGNQSLYSSSSSAASTVQPSALCSTSSSTSSYDINEDHRCGWVGCSAIFDSHEQLTDHVANAHVGHGKSTYTCGWVGCARAAECKQFHQRQKILRHLQTHTGDRPFKCDICSRRFSESNTLAQHKRTHSKEKPYKCDFPGCEAAFAVAGSLTIHKRSRHTNERPFVCTFAGCGRAFAESSNLTKHRRVHTGERPFPCKVCERRFSRPDQLSRHMKVHGSASEDVGEKVKRRRKSDSHNGTAEKEMETIGMPVLNQDHHPSHNTIQHATAALPEQLMV